MRVVIVLNSLSGGGAEKAMKLLANELVHHHQVTVIGINSSTSDGVRLLAQSQSLDRRYRSGVVNTIISLAKFALTIRRLKPHVAIVNCALSELFSLVIPKSVHLIVVEHVNPAWEERRFLGLLIRRYLAARASSVVAVSNHLSFSESERPVDVVIENPIDLPLESASPEEKHDTSTTSLTYIGRLSNPQKKPEVALEIARLSQLPITFIGTGRELNSLINSSKQMHVDAKFIGFVEDPWRNIKEGSLLVVPSAYEGDGLVVIEAIIRGIPLVVSDIPDFRRFDLSETNYFKNLDDLIRTINTNNLGIFRPPPMAKKRLIEERDLHLLAGKWNDLFSSLEPLPKLQ